MNQFTIIIYGSNVVFSKQDNNTFSFRIPAGAINFTRCSKEALSIINRLFSGLILRPLLLIISYDVYCIIIPIFTPFK